MPVRAGIAIAVAGTGVALLFIASLRGRLLTGRTASIIVVVAFLGVVTLLLINEAVRSGGAL